MKTQIQSIHFDADKKLQDLIQGKIDEIYKIHNRIENCNVILKLDKNDKNKNKVVEINLDIPGNRVFVKDQADSFEAAVDMAIDELKKQLNKRKDKVSARNNLGSEILQE
jgi:putative sigma-54 modulation protein